MMVQFPSADHLEDGPRDAVGHAAVNIAGMDATLKNRGTQYWLLTKGTSFGKLAQWHE
jgi:hypothetical protein